MAKGHPRARLLSGLALSALIALPGCGGGGGGGDGSTVTTASSQVSLSASKALVQTESVEGYATQAEVNVSITLTPERDYYVMAQELDGSLITDGDIMGTSNGVAVTLTLSDTLPAGTHDSTLSLKVCADEACKQPLPGGELTVPLRHVVKPQIKANRDALTLSRTGTEAAPSSSVALTVPASAGAVQLSVTTDRPDAFAIDLEGTTVNVGTRQVRAGTYTATVNVQSSVDARQRWRLPVTYTVLPPPGGEHDLIITSGQWISFDGLLQGTQASADITISRATWTSAFTPPTLVGGGGLFSLHDLGNDRYRVTANATVSPPFPSNTSYAAEVRFASATGSEFNAIQASVSARLSANWGRTSGLGQGVYLSDASTIANTKWTQTIDFQSGLPSVQTWRATSAVPWLKLAATSGTIGKDPLQLTVEHTDLSWLPAPGTTLRGEVTITADGSTDTVTVSVPVENGTGQLVESVGSPIVAGRTNRIYIQGARVSAPAPQLTVQGASYSVAAVTQEASMLGDYTYLVLDVTPNDDANQVTVSWQTEFGASRVNLPVYSPRVMISPRFMALTNGPHRSISVRPSTGALAMADTDQIVTLTPPATGGMPVRKVISLPGVLDATYSADGRLLFGATATALVTLDAETHVALSSKAWSIENSTVARPDATAPAWGAMLTAAADGHVFLSTAYGNQPGLSWVRGWGPDITLREQVAPYLWGNTFGMPGAAGVQLARSPLGRVLMATAADGRIMRFTDISRRWSQADGIGAWPPLPAGVTVAAVADENDRFIRSDGVLQVGQRATDFSLASLVPAGDLVGGYGISSDGQQAYIYHYRLDTTGRAPRMVSALLSVVDMRTFPMPDRAGVAVSSQLLLNTGLGCDGLTEVASCVHQAQVVTDPSGELFYVLGPRGVAVTAVGNALVQSAPRARAQAVTKPPRWVRSKPVSHAPGAR